MRKGKVFLAIIVVALLATTAACAGPILPQVEHGTCDLVKQSYAFQVRSASPNADCAVHIEMNGQDVTGVRSLPNTGGWQTYQTTTISGINLNAGEQIMRLYVDGGQFNLNKIDVVTSPVTISNSAFNSSADGWTITTWRASTAYGYGTMTWLSSGAGNPGGGMRCSGSGSTDNTDRCGREGGEISKIISTVGYSNIKVSYGLDVNTLGQNRTGTGIGSCAVDHNLIQEQITVFYTTNGSTWTEAEYLLRATLLGSYQSWGTRVIDLTGVPAANNNPNFGLRFRWQVNSTTDQANLDNIKVTAN